MQKTEKDFWDYTKELLGHYNVTFQPNKKFDFSQDPKRLAFLLSRCKFAMKMACMNRTVLELGCEQGAGAAILAEMATSYTGIDSDPDAIETARKNHSASKFTFLYAEDLCKNFGIFEAIVSFDLFSKTPQRDQLAFVQSIFNQLAEEGIAVIGIPNEEHDDQFEYFVGTLRHFFHRVLPFCMNGEIIHTGAPRQSEYFICICCHKKDK